LFLSVPVAASACDEPSQASLGTVAGRAGETVSISIPGTSRGASYSVTVEGAGAGGGIDVDDVPGMQGSLTIPDLGVSPRAAQGAVSVSCEGGGGWQRPLTVKYAGRPAEAPTTPAQSAAPAAGPSAAAPSAPVVRAKSGGRRSRRSPASGAVKGVRHSFSGLGPAVLDVTKTPRAAVKLKPRKQRKKRRRARRLQSLDQDGSAVDPRPVEPSEGGADLNGGDVPFPAPAIAWQLLAGVALAGLAAIVLVARRTRRRRRLAA
jgi:hypothetical protein